MGMIKNKVINGYFLFLHWFIQKTFQFWQKLGFHITLNHFYQPIPDTRYIPSGVWSTPKKMIGMTMNETKQLQLLSLVSARYADEYEKIPREKQPNPHQYFINNGGFGSVDGEMYYCLIRLFRPSRIIEIGSGNTTYLAVQALRKNAREDKKAKGDLIVIDPFPNTAILSGIPGVSKIIRERVQDFDGDLFQTLGENDMLFIDSSHVLTIGNDVHDLYLHVLPRIRKGGLVHAHDIFLPADYPKEHVLHGHYFWNEQYLLQAFLSFNSTFEVVWASSFMHLNHPKELHKAFSSYNTKALPASFWIRRTR